MTTLRKVLIAAPAGANSGRHVCWHVLQIRVCSRKLIFFLPFPTLKLEQSTFCVGHAAEQVLVIDYRQYFGAEHPVHSVTKAGDQA